MGRSAANPARSGGLWLILSPLFILAVMWLISLVGYGYASAVRDDLLYLRHMAEAENLREDATALSFVWLGLAFSAFGAGCWVATTRPVLPTKFPEWSDDKAIRALSYAFGFVALVAFLWVGLTVIQVGPGRLISLANSNNSYAREVILNGSFPGGRLISNGFMGIAVFSAMFIAMPRSRPLRPERRILAIFFLLISLAYLGLIPILTAGRINFFAAVIASYVAICMVRKRFYGIAYIPVALSLLAVVWGAKQYFTLRHVLDVSLFDQVTQGILFYLYNDTLNALNVVGNHADSYTLGWNSLRFLFFFTFTDSEILTATAFQRAHLAQYMGGGEFPLLTAPYADFGVFGILVVIVFGFLCQSAYRVARRNPPMAALYGFVFAGLVLSIHSSYLTLQDPVFSMILVALLVKASSQRPLVVRRVPRFRATR